jgi:hypothetical protein
MAARSTRPPRLRILLLRLSRSIALKGALALLLVALLALAALRSQLEYALARRHGERSIAHRVSSLFGPRCLVDELTGEASGTPHGGENYLMYAPQFGLGNQQITLRNAVVWALLLNRTLVLPHVLTHSGCSNDSLCKTSALESAPHGELFDLAQSSVLARTLAPLRVVETREFLERVRRDEQAGARALRPRLLLVLGVRALWAYRMDDAYWTLLDLWRHGGAPTVDVPLRSFDAHGIRSAFGACGSHRVLAFRTLFAALEGGEATLAAALPTRALPGPLRDRAAVAATMGKSPREWLDTVAMPALYRPHRALSARVDAMEHTLRARGARLACVHVRIGDIIADCARYEEENKSTSGRAWVKGHFANGYSCFQSPVQLWANLRALQRRAARIAANATARTTSGGASRSGGGTTGRGRRGGGGSRLSMYASIEDSSYLHLPLLSRFNISTQAELGGLGAYAQSVDGSLPLPNAPVGLVAVLLDQMLCARANHLVLNIFSTFSRACHPQRLHPHPHSHPTPNGCVLSHVPSQHSGAR